MDSMASRIPHYVTLFSILLDDLANGQTGLFKIQPSDKSTRRTVGFAIAVLMGSVHHRSVNSIRGDDKSSSLWSLNAGIVAEKVLWEGI